MQCRRQGWGRRARLFRNAFADFSGISILTTEQGDALRLRVLIADDYPDAADSLATLLRLWGHDCDVACNGRSAARATEKQTYDVIIAELSLPGWSGLDLAEDVRRRLGHWPVLIALTGFSSPQLRRRASACGFDHFLVKPSDPDALRCLLEEVDRVPVG
jgi:two-component system CheB/CheR fusion protein